MLLFDAYYADKKIKKEYKYIFKFLTLDFISKSPPQVQTI